MLIRSKRRTQSQTSGREAGDTWDGVGGRLVGVAVTPAWDAPVCSSTAGEVPHPAQEEIVKSRVNPSKYENAFFIDQLQYSTHAVHCIGQTNPCHTPPWRGFCNPLKGHIARLRHTRRGVETSTLWWPKYARRRIPFLLPERIMRQD